MNLWLEDFELQQYINRNEPYAVWNAMRSLTGTNYYGKYDSTYPVPFIFDSRYVGWHNA